MSKIKSIDGNDKDIYQMFSSRLRTLMVEAEEVGTMPSSYVSLGDEIGVVRQTASQWCRGETLPSSELLYKLADTYRVSSDWLLGRSVNRIGNISNKDVSDSLGISTKAANALYHKEALEFLNALLSYKDIKLIANAYSDLVNGKCKDEDFARYMISTMFSDFLLEAIKINEDKESEE